MTLIEKFDCFGAAILVVWVLDYQSRGPCSKPNCGPTIKPMFPPFSANELLVKV